MLSLFSKKKINLTNVNFIDSNIKIDDIIYEVNEFGFGEFFIQKFTTILQTLQVDPSKYSIPPQLN